MSALSPRAFAAAMAFSMACAILPVTASPGADAEAAMHGDGRFRLQYTSDLQPIVINRIHDWTITVTTAGGAAVVGAEIAVDGGMPAHDHGLPTAPRITAELGDGRYRLSGLRFHMHGEWQMQFRITTTGAAETVVVVLTL